MRKPQRQAWKCSYERGQRLSLLSVSCLRFRLETTCQVVIQRKGKEERKMRKNLSRWLLVVVLLLAVLLIHSPTVDAAHDPGGGGCGVSLTGFCARIKGYSFQCTPRYEKLGSSAYCTGCVPVNYRGIICGGTEVYVLAWYYNSCMAWGWYYVAGFGWIGADWISSHSCWG